MKHIILTGGSGGIGGAVARRFHNHGWAVHLLLRSLDKHEVQTFMQQANVFAYKSNPEHREEVVQTLQSLKHDGVIPAYIFHAAGTFLWDNGFPGKEHSFQEVRAMLLKANVETKTSLVSAVEQTFSNDLSRIEQGFVGSHAAHFDPKGVERLGHNGYTQEAYVESMALVESIACRLRDEGQCKGVYLFEPGFVNTGLNKAFTKETLGFDPEWHTRQTPEEYAEAIFPESFFTDRR